MPIKWLDKNTVTFGTLKSIVEIIAIIMGGFLVFSRYVYIEAPSLEHFMVGGGTVSISYADTTKIRIDYDLGFENQSKSTFDIDSIQIKTWVFTYDSLITYPWVDLEYFNEHRPCYDSFTSYSQILCSHYPAGAKTHLTYVYFWPVDYNTSVFFKYIVFAHSENFIGCKTLFNVTGTSLALHLAPDS